MRHSSLPALQMLGSLVALSFVACVDSRATNAGDVGTGGSFGDGGSGGIDSSCMEREQQSSNAVSEAFAAATLACETRVNCEFISNDTDCHAACGALVAVDDKAAIQAVIDELNMTTCEGFEADGCQRLIPPCIRPPDFDCVAGRCEEVTSGNSNSGCIDQEISWGLNGGLVAYQDQQTLAPCNTFAIERTGFADPGGAAHCQNSVDASATVGPDDIDNAMANADVQAAIDAAPVLYGTDPRPVDGTVFRIEIGSAVIDVGGDCAGASGCTSIPAGVAALRTALQAIEKQQRALPDCDALP